MILVAVLLGALARANLPNLESAFGLLMLQLSSALTSPWAMHTLLWRGGVTNSIHPLAWFQESGWTTLFSIVSQICWKSTLFSWQFKAFQNLFGQTYLFGAEVTGKLRITALHVEIFTVIVVFWLWNRNILLQLFGWLHWKLNCRLALLGKACWKLMLLPVGK